MKPEDIDSRVDDATIIDPSSDLLREAPKRRPSKKLKYKDKGYRIEISDDGNNWRLKQYYKNALDMRQAYSSRNGNSYSWAPSYHYRMVYPDGRILPERWR